MNIIVDTHIFLWALSEPERLSEKSVFELKRTDNSVFLSAVSVTEIMIKASLGKLDFIYNPIDLARETGFETIEFSVDDALRLKELPFHHRDPFDRMLIAQSICRDFALMSTDEKFSHYSCQLI